MRVHERIRKYIKETGLKQYVIAKKAGFSDKQFSAMMTGRRKIYADDIEKICSALGVAPDTFIIPKYSAPHRASGE